MRSHPLARALRIDKLDLAALDVVLRLYLDPERAIAECDARRDRGRSRTSAARQPAARAADRRRRARGPVSRSSAGRPRRRRVAAGHRAAERRGPAAVPAAEADAPRRTPAPRRAARGRRVHDGACSSTCATVRRGRARGSRRSRLFGLSLAALSTIVAAHARHRRSHRSRQDRAGHAPDRHGHRPPARGEGARHLHRARLRAAGDSRRAHVWASSTCPGHERFVTQHARRRERRRPRAAGRGRRRRRHAADARAPRHPRAARRARGVVALTKARPGRRRVARAGRTRTCASCSPARPIATCRGRHRQRPRRARHWPSCWRRSSALAGRPRRAAATSPARLPVDRVLPAEGHRHRGDRHAVARRDPGRRRADRAARRRPRRRAQRAGARPRRPRWCTPAARRREPAWRRPRRRRPRRLAGGARSSRTSGRRFDAWVEAPAGCLAAVGRACAPSSITGRARRRRTFTSAAVCCRRRPAGSVPKGGTAVAPLSFGWRRSLSGARSLHPQIAVAGAHAGWGGRPRRRAPLAASRGVRRVPRRPARRGRGRGGPCPGRVRGVAGVYVGRPSTPPGRRWWRRSTGSRRRTGWRCSSPLPRRAPGAPRPSAAGSSRHARGAHGRSPRRALPGAPPSVPSGRRCPPPSWPRSRPGSRPSSWRRFSPAWSTRSA